MSQSKDLWLSIDSEVTTEPVVLGKYSSDDYINDPKHFGMVASRYKFCARMLEGLELVIEVGCGDGFGSAAVASTVKQLICTDINEALLADNRRRNSFLTNVTYEYFQFQESPYPLLADGIFMVDVLEHIYPEEEPQIMGNLVSSLDAHGVALIGTPNKSAEQYSSEWSRKSHVNLKDHQSLKDLANRYFHNVFIFGMNDEVVHTGFLPMAHYLWALCVTPRKAEQAGSLDSV